MAEPPLGKRTLKKPGGQLLKIGAGATNEIPHCSLLAKVFPQSAVRNIASNPRVRLKLRHGVLARWHSGTAHLLAEDNPRERQKWLARQLPSSAVNAAVVRLFGTELLTVRIDLDT